MQKKGLGKGLQALIPTGSLLSEDDERVAQIPADQIEPNSYQPRRVFDEAKLEELAQSIREHGMVQPVVVRRLPDGKYELVAGERRWRACRRLEMATIPAVVKEMSEREVAEVALVENVQREDLNPLEEAWAYHTLLEEFGLKQEDVAKRVGKSRSHIANTVRLLQLPETVREAMVRGQLSAGHGRALLGLPDKEMRHISAAIAEKGLSVRETEELVRRLINEKPKKTEPTKRGKTGQLADLRAVEDKLQEYLGTKVRLRAAGKSGRIEIEFYGTEDLTRIIDLMTINWT